MELANIASILKLPPERIVGTFKFLEDVMRNPAAKGGITMKRREFLTASATAVVLAAAPGPASSQDAAVKGEHYPIGDFILRRLGNGLQVMHKRKPDRILWETAVGDAFLVAEVAKADIREFGAPEGTFSIVDAVSVSYERTAIETVTSATNGAVVSGKLAGEGGEVGFKLAFEAVSPTHLRFVLEAEGARAAGVNRIRLRSGSTRDEAFFGFGEQLTYFNQKGHVLPILVQEHGIGRGRPIITQLVDVFDRGSGGNPYHTGKPAPHFISSRLRSMFLENLEYSEFDLRPADHVDIKVWSGVMTGHILYGESPLELIETYTEYAGRMRVLPDWVHNGAILGLMGGTEPVRAKLESCPQGGYSRSRTLAPGLGRRAQNLRRHAAVVELEAGRDLLPGVEEARRATSRARAGGCSST